jgi:hypothetical protein
MDAEHYRTNIAIIIEKEIAAVLGGNRAEPEARQ